MIEQGLSQVVTYTPSGTQPRWLGAVGHVEDLVYSWANPGGAEQLSATLQAEPTLRTDAMNPGRIVKVIRGGQIVWDGKMLEPTYQPGTGWLITAAGIGVAGADFAAVYSSAWGSAGNQNDAVNQAITRGLRWVNPGIPSSVWFGQAVDSGADTITDLLNLFCTKGSLTWYVTTTHYGNNLSVYAFPQAPTVAQANRILVAAQPQSRTMGGDVNALYGRYQTSADAATAATFATTVVTNAADIAAHGRVEAFDDLSSTGQQTLATVQAALQSVLNRYQRASWGGPFVVHYGELLNTGGAPVDLGIDHCSTICKVILADTAYGGEVLAEPVVFMVGSYQWDEHNQVATVAPFQSLDLSMSGLLQEIATVLPGIPQRPKPHHRSPLPHKQPGSAGHKGHRQKHPKIPGPGPGHKGPTPPRDRRPKPPRVQPGGPIVLAPKPPRPKRGPGAGGAG